MLLLIIFVGLNFWFGFFISTLLFFYFSVKKLYLLGDFVKLSKISTEDMLFDEHDLDNCMERIETMNFHQQIEVNGIKFIPFNVNYINLINN
jgi:cleavage and polyadenylation specificity factor subunit 3